MPKKEEEAVEAKNEPIINTEAAKAKAEEIGENAKKGINDAIDKVKSNDNLKIVCGAVVAVVVLCVIVLLLGGGGSKKPVKAYASGFVKMDAKRVCKTYAKEIIEEQYDDLDDCVDDLKEAFEYMEDEEIKYDKYKIEGSKKLDKDDVEDIAEKLEDAYDIDEKKVKKVVRYKVSFDAKGKDNDQDLFIFSAKIKGKWVVVGASTSKDYRGM